VVARQWYYPYGAVRGSSGTLPTQRTFNNQYNDASTGLLFFNARYYSGALGRFVSADSIVPGAGNPQALNRYAFVYGNPLKYTDPSGHAGTCLYGAEDCASIPTPRKPPKPPTPPTPPKAPSGLLTLWNMTPSELLRYAQNQMPDYPSGCACFSMAMAGNLLSGTGIKGSQMVGYAESMVLKGKGLQKLPGIGMMPQAQADTLNAFSAEKGLNFAAEYKSGGLTSDLIDNLKNGYVTIVSISWGGRDNWPTDPAIGHAMVVVGYDPSTTNFLFLDPASGNLVTDFSKTYGRDFLNAWQRQGHAFIPGGSMVTVKPK
jgi:RHS repeat-associated protein